MNSMRQHTKIKAASSENFHVVAARRGPHQHTSQQCNINTHIIILILYYYTYFIFQYMHARPSAHPHACTHFFKIKHKKFSCPAALAQVAQHVGLHTVTATLPHCHTATYIIHATARQKNTTAGTFWRCTVLHECLRVSTRVHVHVYVLE